VNTDRRLSNTTQEAASTAGAAAAAVSTIKDYQAAESLVRTASVIHQFLLHLLAL
jgi:hypothetical protein